MSRRMMMRTVSAAGGGPYSALYFELENGVIGSEFSTLTDAGASNGSYVRSEITNTNAPTTAASYVECSLADMTAGTYELWVRCRVVDGTTDSFFQQVNGGTWAAVNGISTQITANTWTWIKIWINTNYGAIQTFTATAGTQVIRIGRREPMDIDRLYFTQNADTPV